MRPAIAHPASGEVSHPGRLPTAQRYMATFDEAKDLIREAGLARSGEPGSPSRSGTAGLTGTPPAS